MDHTCPASAAKPYLVERLHETVDELQDTQFILVLAIHAHAHDEEERRVLRGNRDEETITRRKCTGIVTTFLAKDGRSIQET